MTIDEAIKHCEEVAEDNERDSRVYNYLDSYKASECAECGKEHEQLANWLRELKEIREQQNKIIQILDDCDLEAWEILEKIKEVVKV